MSDSPARDSSFSARFNRIMRLTLTVVLFISGGLAYLQFDERRRAERDLLVQRLDERAQALNFIMKSSADYVEAMRLAGESWYTVQGARPPARPPLLEAALAQASEGMWRLDDIPKPYERRHTGNLTGLEQPLDDSLRYELEMALSLNPLFEVIAKNIPNAAWSYYTSKRNFILIHPWVPSSEFKYTPELYTHGFYTEGLPENNRERRRFWTEAYIDQAGKGLMVTCGAPVYEGDGFRGTVALDLTLDVLNEFVRAFSSPHGTLFVVNERGQLLAHPTAVASADKAVKTVADALPPALASLNPATLLAGTSQSLDAVGAHYVWSRKLADAPWRLVYVGDRLAMLRDLFVDAGTDVAALLIGLSLMLLMATRATRREFIAPAQKLVDHIELESRAAAVGIPDVPEGWRPWFETITRIFNDHGQLVSIRQELDVARRMQHSILPTRFPSRPDVQLHARMIAAKEVGGDFYDFFWLDANRLGIAIADVSGKGVPAALFMAVARTLLRATAPTTAGPGPCLALANDLLSQENDTGMFVTLFYAVFDTATGHLSYANGGHNPPFLIGADGIGRALPTTGGMALGVLEGESYAEGAVDLGPGDSLFLYTDGVTEAFDTGGRLFTEARLAGVLDGGQSLGAADLVDKVVHAVEGFAAGAAQSDDITCVALHFTRPLTAGAP
ncbi:MAG: SpoIIE family protein phosphatase [Magnetospirillum sp. WYHS-4]